MSSTWTRAILRTFSFPSSIFSAAVLLLVATQSPLMRAQTSNAQLSGLVTDTTGAVVAGADVNATNQATNVDYHSVSNGSGIYVQPELFPSP